MNQYIMQLAIGTSLGAIVVGSFSSLRTHDRHHAVDWPVVKRAATSVLLAPVGARLAHRLNAVALRRIFAFFLVVMGAKLAINV